MKLRKMTVIILAFLGLSITSLAVAPEAEAQTGGGVDVCTYYSANGFSTQQECNNWLDWQKQSNWPSWKDQMDKCLILSGISLSPEAMTGELTSSALTVSLRYGASFITCMFG